MPQFCPISCRKPAGYSEYELDRRQYMQRIDYEERTKAKYRNNTQPVIVKHEVVIQQPDCTQDLILKCQDCGGNFVFTVGEQQFYKSKGFTIPKRCKACRDANKKNNTVNNTTTTVIADDASSKSIGSIATLLTGVLKACIDASSNSNNK